MYKEEGGDSDNEKYKETGVEDEDGLRKDLNSDEEEEEDKEKKDEENVDEEKDNPKEKKKDKGQFSKQTQFLFLLYFINCSRTSSDCIITYSYI